MHAEAANSVAAEPCFATTAGVPVREKFDFWHEVVTRNLVDLEYELIGRQPFDATFAGCRLGMLNLSRIEASPHRAARSSIGIARSDTESLVFNFVLSGSLQSEQDGRRTWLKVGDGAFCDARRPYVLQRDEPFTIASLQVPRAVVAARISGLDRMSAINLCERSELAPMVFGYLSQLAQRASKLDPAIRAKVGQNFTELLVALLAEFADANPLPQSEYRNLTLMRIKDLVERNLGNDKLGPDFVAAELKLSPRYINNLLEAEDTSLSRYIWQRRLERSAEQLRDPGLRGRTISVIALNNGFNDLSHFSKAFRERFSLSPRDYRSRIITGHGRA